MIKKNRHLASNNSNEFYTYECTWTCGTAFVYKGSKLIECVFHTNHGYLNLFTSDETTYLIIRRGSREVFRIKQNKSIEELIKQINPNNVNKVWKKKYNAYNLLK